jgi:hypothetical protein
MPKKNRPPKAGSDNRERKIQQRQARREAFMAESPRYLIRHAREHPIYECWINQEWQESGLATILISRRQPNGNLIFGGFLVDIFCLGVKNVLYNANLSEDEYREALLPEYFLVQTPEPCSVELAHAIIYGGIDYAAQFGFKPDRDFEMGSSVLEERGTVAPPREPVTFGRDGKPFYVNGPNDNPRAILARLEKNPGPGNYDYSVSVGGPPALFDFLDED